MFIFAGLYYPLGSQLNDMETPSQKLTARILKRLVEEKILRKDDARALAPKIASGTIRQEDWRLAIEKALERKERK